MKNFIFLFSILLVSNLSFAQRVDFGLKAGANFLYIEDQNRIDPGNISLRVDYHIGGLAHISLSKLFAIQPEVVYSKEGAAYSNNTFAYRGNDVFNYVNIPLLFQFTPGHFRIEAGPQFGINTRADFDTFNFKGIDGILHKTDIKKTDWAIVFGLSYITHYYVGVDVRANLGVGTLYKDGTHPGQYARNRALQAGIFYQFPNRKTTALKVKSQRKKAEKMHDAPTTN